MWILLSKYYPWPKRQLAFFTKKRYPYTINGAANAFENLLEQDAMGNLSATAASVSLSVIIPAMNEEKRLPLMLDECLAYLDEKSRDDKGFTYEIIVVDDGSSDGTNDAALHYAKKAPLRVLKLDKNVGKGGATRQGVLCASGQKILFVDADGATKFSDLSKLDVAMNELTTNGKEDAVVIGSRSHLEKDSIAQRSLFRTILMVGFHSLVYLFAVRSVRDTQCGFKLFSRKAAAKLFPRIHIERWAFDVELLYLAERLRIPIKEVAVEWHEVDGSKVVPLLTSIEMGRDILLIWMSYRTRRGRQSISEDVSTLPYDADRLHMEEEIMTNTYELEFAKPAELEKYLRKMRIEITHESMDKMELEFDLVGIEAPIANGLRRVLIAETPTMAIEKVYLYQNTSCIPDEVLCHRIGLIPIYADPRAFDFPSQKFVPVMEGDEAEMEPLGDPNEHVIFNFHIRGYKNAHPPAGSTDPKQLFKNYNALSKNFLWHAIGDQKHEFVYDPIRVVHDDIVVAKLRPGQEIEASCHCVKGIGRDHAKFSPVATASYRLLPEIILKRRLTGMDAINFQSCFSAGVVDIVEECGEKVARVIDARKDMSSRNVFRFDELKDAVDMRKKKDYFLFSVESTGALTSYELVIEACRILKDKARNLCDQFVAEFDVVNVG